MKKKPLIGLTLDLENNKSYSKYPWYAIRQNYCCAVSNMGGIPVPLVYDINSINTMVEKLDGFIITGGAFDVNPSYFSEKTKFGNVVTKESRTEYEIKLCNNILKNNLPLLGICGGQQLLNVIYGGSLIQDIDKEINTTIKHEQPNPRNQTSHSVKIIKNTFLSTIVKTNNIKVNSAHHQAVKKVGSGLNVNALAPDGIIEGIEDKSLSFCMGLQWHPEFLIEASDRLIYKKFIQIARINGKR